MLIGNQSAGERFGMAPRARVVATAVTGSDPTIMLALAGLSIDDIDLIELNEAFASVVLKFQRDMKIRTEKVNVNGGAIAMGHPLGTTGAMLVDELERRGQKRAVITLCVGGGMGIATIIERV